MILITHSYLLSKHASLLRASPHGTVLKDTEERYVILEGEGLAEVGEEAFEVSIGDVVVIPAGVAQRIKNTGSNNLRFLAICQPRFLVENYMSFTPPK